CETVKCKDKTLITQSTFLYFAYGGNLLKERLQLKNPSATVHSFPATRGYQTCQYL
uniref:Gamma-glutamylcyclotransferase n=1 Tax=Neogobius melanostomus TaxID=47308 RepID=A0A8C6UGJ8_9GOBI